MVASNLRMVVCNTEEREMGLEELVQLSLKVLHTSGNSTTVQQFDANINVIHDINFGDWMSSNSVIMLLLPLVSDAYFTLLDLLTV